MRVVFTRFKGRGLALITWARAARISGAAGDSAVKVLCAALSLTGRGAIVGGKSAGGKDEVVFAATVATPGVDVAEDS